MVGARVPSSPLPSPRGRNGLPEVPAEWVPDREAARCMQCDAAFWFLRRRHHCRACGAVCCDACTRERAEVSWHSKRQRVCRCVADAIKEAEENERALFVPDRLSAALPSLSGDQPADSASPVASRRRRVRLPGCTDESQYSTRVVRCTSAPGAPAANQEKVKELISLASALHLQDRVLEAEGAVVKAEEAQGSVPDWGSDAELVQQIRKRAVHTRNALKSIATDDGWRLCSDVGGIRTLHRCVGGSIHETRVEGEVDAPVFFVVALLNEIDLFPLWVPKIMGFGINSADTLAVPSVTKRVAFVDVKLPWPMAMRDVTFAVDGVTVPKTQVATAVAGKVVESPENADEEQKDESGQRPDLQVVIMLNSVTSSSECDVPSPKNGAVRIDLFEGSGIVLSRGKRPGGCFVQAVMRIDPKMMVPDWLLNLSNRQLAYIFIHQVRRAVELVKGEQWRERYCNPDNAFYSYMRRRILADLPEQANTLPPVDPTLRQ
eukprot:TRINITY_DN8941_c0_g1_i1.p1 TRINITY_DN8941_c0_g1~~TRINITY_DN8941_c0_g1_i1.p1  ORF type:complete len:491 (+),score=160.45 TRINITY_DN8941_c0_g1_i1:57-1529(+)